MDIIFWYIRKQGSERVNNLLKVTQPDKIETHFYLRKDLRFFHDNKVLIEIYWRDRKIDHSQPPISTSPAPTKGWLSCPILYKGLEHCGFWYGGGPGINPRWILRDGCVLLEIKITNIFKSTRDQEVFQLVIIIVWDILFVGWSFLVILSFWPLLCARNSGHYLGYIVHALKNSIM